MVYLFLLTQLFFVNAKSVTTQTDFYYGADLIEDSTDTDFKNRLHAVLKGSHSPNTMDFDSIGDSCNSDNRTQCFVHKPLTYKQAREHLFGSLHLQKTNDGEYYIRTIYCLQVMTNADFPHGQGIGPNQIPDNKILNVEHSWPQSKFTKSFPEGTQKADLHHLFPALSHVNSIRGNHPFGTVQTETKDVCENAKFGESPDVDEPIFEPPMESKGNIARALFYFSVRYKREIDPVQESELRQWHELDPVDFDEISRSNAIFDIQKVRNPFIDHPEWTNRVEDF